MSSFAAFAQTAAPVLKVEDGGTGANTAASARINLGAAAAGANNDITSLSGITTPLPASEGGTGSTEGVSPTGSLTTTPETVINIADFGGCNGSTTSDTVNVNAALAAARSSSAYASNQPVRVVGGFAANGFACAVSQINATGFNQFGGGSRLILEDITLLCSGRGNICLDAIGSLNLQFNRVTVIGSSTNPPMIGIQEGNFSPSTNACCIHTHYGLEITGSFTFAGLYSAASESTTYYSPIVRNNGASLGFIGAFGIVSGGSGYTNGTFAGVGLTGSSTGYGAVATITISGGIVTAISLTNQGKQYAIGDTLSASSPALGTGTGLTVQVTNIGQFSMVMDGQNHWGVSSAFVAINWPYDTYYTFTENNIIGGSLRYYGSSYKGAPLWIGSVEGLRTVHLYIAQLSTGPCVFMFDNNASYTLHNINETLEIECETSAATYDVQLTGSNAAPKINGLTLVDQLSTVNSGILGIDSNISNVAAHNSTINIGYSTANPPLFSIGSSGSWALDGFVSVPYPWEYNAPASTNVTGNSGGMPTAGAGPLDFLSSNINVAAAYSCARRLAFQYNGPLCSIRRASDSSTIDFYANASGTIDKSALRSFCANTSCFISIEYDQSGNSNNAVNTTLANQPPLALESSSLNYATCGTWTNGSNIALDVAANSSINNLFANGGYISAISNKTSTITNSMRLISKLSGGSGWELSGAYSLGYGYPQFSIDGSTSNGAWVSASFMPSFGPHIFDVNYSYSNLNNAPTVSIDGASLAFQTSTTPVGVVNDGNGLIIGNNSAGGFGWPGDICEVILARQSLSPAQIDAIRRNQAVFYGIPGVL
jgi:hypothetical protein